MKKPPTSFEDICTLTTQDLLVRARDGSHAAWEVFYRRYREFLVFAVRMRIPGFARREFDAEDVLQSAFLSAWREIKGFEYRGEGSFRSWLRGIVINNFRNKLRANHHAAETTESKLLRRAERAGHESREHDPAALAAQAEEEARFLEKLRALPESDQELLGMRVFERLSWNDIGAILECDRVTARKRCGEAVKRLERLLD